MVTTHWISNKEILNAVNAVYSKYPAKVANCALGIMNCNNEMILEETLYKMFAKENPEFPYHLAFVNPTNPEHVEVVCKFVAKHPELYEECSEVFTPINVIKINPEW